MLTDPRNALRRIQAAAPTSAPRPDSLRQNQQAARVKPADTVGQRRKRAVRQSRHIGRPVHRPRIPSGYQMPRKITLEDVLPVRHPGLAVHVTPPPVLLVEVEAISGNP